MQAQQLGVSAGRHHFWAGLFFKGSLHSRPFFHKSSSSPLHLQAINSRSRLIQVSATFQENVAVSSSGTFLVKVKFVLEKKCEFGQQFNVVGDDESFGAWNPEASIPMQWSEGHIWTTEMEVFAGKRVEFKVVLMGGETVVDWQPGPNRVLETSEASTSPVILETHWGEDDSLEENGAYLIETADIESFTKLAASQEILSNSVMDQVGLDFAAEASDSNYADTTVDEAPVETEVSEPLSAGLADEDTGKHVERKLSVLEKDLQWGREALSKLFGTFRRKGNNNKV